MTHPETVPLQPAEDEPAPVAVRRGRGPILLVASLVLALLLGVGGWAGLTLLSAGGPAAQEVTPASAVAFAGVDLVPGLGQQRKLAALLGKFPKLFTGEELRPEGEDFRADVAPWLGRRFGAALWLHGGEAYTLLTAASTDDDTARRGLARIQGRQSSDDFGFVVADGHVLIARGDHGAQAAAEAAHAEAVKTPLSSVQAYKDAVGWLPEERFAHAYADLAGVSKAMTALTRVAIDGAEDVPLSSLGSFGVLPGLGGTGKDATGTAVIGVSAADSGLEVRFRTFGATASPAPAVSVDLLADIGKLSGASVVAGSARLPELPEEMLGAFGGPDAEDLEGLDPEEIAEIQAELADGLSLTKALKALDSARLTFAVTELGDLLPTLFAALDAKDATVAKDLASALKEMEVPLTVTVQGTHVEAVAQGYRGSSKLADNPLFQQAIAGLPAKPDAAVYVDVTRLLEQADADAETRSTAAPIKAIAVATAPLGADTGGMLRIVIQ